MPLQLGFAAPTRTAPVDRLPFFGQFRNMKSHCFEILLKPEQFRELPSVIFAVGDDAFLRNEATTNILAIEGLEFEQARVFDGEECTWGQVHDELASFSLFDADAKRVVVLKMGEKLLKDLEGEGESRREKKRNDYREQIEKWCESPADGSLLIMHLASLPASTRLHKIVDKRGWIILCGLPTASANSKSPDMGKLKDWIIKWASFKHGLHLEPTQVTLILDAVGPQCGLLHQELAKLSLYADDSGKLPDNIIRSNVGSWATRTVWEISDAIMDGRVAHAMDQLQHLFASGEPPQAIVPQIAWSLRRYGIAAQLVQQSRRMGRPLTADQVVGSAGFWGVDLKLAPQRLRRIGLNRATDILEWLLELDLKLKGSHSSTDRAIFALEELCLRFV